VYVLAEKIKRGKDRVNIEKLGPEDNRRAGDYRRLHLQKRSFG